MHEKPQDPHSRKSCIDHNQVSQCLQSKYFAQLESNMAVWAGVIQRSWRQRNGLNDYILGAANSQIPSFSGSLHVSFWFSFP